MAKIVADSHRRMLVRGPVLFGVGAEQDAKDSTETIAAVDQVNSEIAGSFDVIVLVGSDRSQ